MEANWLVFGGSESSHPTQEEAEGVAASGDLDWWHVVKVDADGLVVVSKHRSGSVQDEHLFAGNQR